VEGEKIIKITLAKIKRRGEERKTKYNSDIKYRLYFQNIEL